MKVIVPFLLLATCMTLHGQKVEVMEWMSTATAQPAKLQSSGAEWLPAFRLALRALPEKDIVALSLSQPQMLGLSKQDAASLHRLTQERYALMSSDAAFQKAVSALGYCYQETRPTEGLATVYVPRQMSAKTQTLVFVHGFGGSFLWYLHVLAEGFPDALIICPAYGIDTSRIPADYLQECMVEATKRFGPTSGRPYLIGLSAGGFGACRAYASSPAIWSRMICLAAYAPEDTARSFVKGMDLKFLSGGDELFARDGRMARGAQQASQQGAVAEARTIPGSGHFFLLEKREETVAVLQEWINRPQ